MTTINESKYSLMPEEVFMAVLNIRKIDSPSSSSKTDFINYTYLQETQT